MTRLDGSGSVCRSVARQLAVFAAAGLMVMVGACSTTQTAARVDTTYQPYACLPPPRSTPPVPVPGAPQRVAVIGDSYTNGSPQGGTGQHRWTAVVERDLRARGYDVVIDLGAEGGSGYVTRGNRGDVFADKVATTVRPDDAMVVFFGSRNDSRASEGDLAHATCTALMNAEIAAPGAQLVVIGPPWVDANPPRYVQRARDILQDRAESLHARFIDPLADGWFVDRPDLIGTDGVHPTNEGHAYMAQRITPVIESMLAAHAAP